MDAGDLAKCARRPAIVANELAAEKLDDTDARRVQQLGLIGENFR